MAQKKGRSEAGANKKRDLSGRQRAFLGKKVNKTKTRKFTRIKKAEYALNKIVAVMSKGEQLVDFPKGKNRRYGPRQFHKNMLGGMLLNGSSTACAELSKIRAIADGTEATAGCEWQRLRLITAYDKRTVRVHRGTAHEAIDQLRRDNRLPDTVTFAADLHFEERWDGAQLITRGVSLKQAGINREARRRLARKRGLVKSRHSRGTCWFEAYIVLQIVDKGAQIVLACLPVDDLSDLARFIPIMAKEIKAAGIARARILLDRQFFDEADVRGLEMTGFRWIVPCRNTPEVKRALAEAVAKGKDTGVVRMTITGRDGRKSEYWMRYEPRKKGEEDEEDAGRGRKGGRKLEPHQRLIGFAMSHKSEKPRRYRKRWGIETRFKMVSNRRIKTSSPLPNVRLLAFVYSLMGTNVWVMINSVFWRRPSDYVPRISLAAVLSMSVRMLEIREPKPPP